MAQTKFIDRFIKFFLVEQRLKWKVYLTSVVIASAWAVFRFFSSRKSEEEISQEAAIILGLLVMSYVIVYVAKGKPSSVKAGDSRIYPRFTLRSGLAAAAGLVLITAMVKIDIPKMQAAIIDTKLETFVTFLDTVQAANVPEQQLRNRYEKIQSIVSVSSANQIPVDPDILQNAQSAISHSLKRHSYSEQTRQLGWTTSIDLGSLAYTRKIQTGAITPVPTRQIANTGGYLFTIPISINGKHNVHILGDHSWIALAPGGRFVVNQSTVSFDKIDFLGSGTGPTIELVGDDSGAVVYDSIMKSVLQSLDRITWVDVRFEGSRLLYTEGAPLRLRNVTFKDCDLSHLGIGPVTYQLAMSIKDADGQPVTFIYEPQP